MRQHLVTIILVVMFVITLFSVWLVQFFSQQFENSLSGQLTEVHGLVEYQLNNQEWQTAFPGQRVSPGMHLRITADSSALLSFNSLSRLTLEPETELQYLGYVNGQPSWVLLSGSLKGRYVSTAKPLLITIDESTIAVTIATFEAVNTLEQQYVTVFDQSVTVASAKTVLPDVNQAAVADEAVVVVAGETYQLATTMTTADEGTPVTPSISTEETVVSTDSAILITPPPTIVEIAPTNPPSEIKLTIGQPTPLTFVWVDQSIQNQPSSKNSATFRLLRGKSPTLDETSADAYRTTSGQNLTSYQWPLPDKNSTYYVRVCRLSGKTCAAYSNTLTFIGQTEN